MDAIIFFLYDSQQIVYDVGPTLNQYWLTVLCLLGIVWKKYSAAWVDVNLVISLTWYTMISELFKLVIYLIRNKFVCDKI